jgi:predicted TIM-barrel fold metal-dependent hydrolase
MMYTCAARGAAATGSKRGKLVKRGKRTLAVDLHCHVHTPAAAEVAKQTAVPAADPISRHGSQRTADRQREQDVEIQAQLTSIERRLADMDRMAIDIQAISTSPAQYYYRIEPELGRKTSRLVNERLAEIVASHPERFVALGTLPMQDPRLAVAEMEYCMKTLGFRGIELGTNVRRVELADERFNPVFAKAEELGAVIFLHPSGFTDTSRLGPHFLTNVIGNPLDTTVALAHIVYGGVLERYPAEICRRARWRLHGPLPGARGPCLQGAARVPRPHQAPAVPLHEKDLLRHHGVQPRAARAPGEPVGSGARRDRYRLSLRHGVVQAGRLRERREAYARAEGSHHRPQRREAAGPEEESVMSDA